MATLATGNNVLDFSVCQDSSCESFTFSETTGLYTTSNSGGWAVVAGAGASVNFTPSDAISAYLSVTLPNGTIIPSILIYPTFPDSAGLNTYVVTNTALGLSGSLSDGIYSITYQVNINNVSSQTVILTITKSFFFGCTIKCCVDKLISKIPESDCDCESVALKKQA